jgi:outer membrane protein assembly factor BamB
MRAFEYDIFVSYSRRDKSFVEFLVRTLERAELKCFQDVSGLKVFDKLDSSLKAAISDSRWLVAIISPAYLQSYWCMFEALEAIEGQDLELRFFPIVVRYTGDDQSLDEDFVMTALEDLDKQMKEFESKLIRLKAYDLAPKLDKLRFLRTNLPRVFQQIQARIFPEFALWDRGATRATLANVLERLAPDVAVDVETLELDFDTLEAQPLVIPRLQPLPVVLWKTRVGKQAWKNSPVVVGNDVLVGSCGERWNSPSVDTGIYCLDAESGKIKWFARTEADPNRLMVSKGIVVTGCDDGHVVAVSARDGSARWNVALDSGVVGGPVKLDANRGGAIGDTWRIERGEDPVLVTTHAGGVYLLDLRTGAQLQLMTAGGTILANPAVWQDGIRTHIFVPTLEGRLALLAYSNIAVELREVRALAVTFEDEHASSGESSAVLAAQPAVAGSLILQGFARETYYGDPPLVAIDALTGNIVWRATRTSSEDHFGNLRSPPAIVSGQAIFACAYTQGLCSVSLADGKELWTLNLGQGMFEQWSGPISDGRSIYLGRHDGYLHKVNVTTKKREWSLYLGDAEHAGVAVAGQQSLPEFDATFSWRSGESAPILATPVLDRGRLYVGTHEGYLFAIGNLGPSDG